MKLSDKEGPYSLQDVLDNGFVLINYTGSFFIDDKDSLIKVSNRSNDKLVLLEKKLVIYLDKWDGFMKDSIDFEFDVLKCQIPVCFVESKQKKYPLIDAQLNPELTAFFVNHFIANQIEPSPLTETSFAVLPEVSEHSIPFPENKKSPHPSYYCLIGKIFSNKRRREEYTMLISASKDYVIIGEGRLQWSAFLYRYLTEDRKEIQVNKNEISMN